MIQGNKVKVEEDEIYLDLCDSTVQPLVATPAHTNSSQQCPEQELRLSLAFVTGLATFGFGSFLMGVVFDRFGLRVIRLITIMALVLLVSRHNTRIMQFLANHDSCQYYTLGELLIKIIADKDYLIGLVNAEVAQLAGRRSSSLQGIFGGLLNSSFTFQAIKMAHDSGFSRRNSMLIASCVWVLGIPLSWLLPRTKVPKNYTWKEKKFFTVDGFWLSPVDQLKPIRSLKSCVFSIQFILLLMWLAILHVCWQMHTNSYNKWVTGIVHGNNDKVSFYTDLLAWLMLGSLLFAPMAGVVLDCARSKMMASTKAGQDSAPVAVAPSLILSSTVAVAMTAASLWENESAIYVCNVLFVIGKSFTYTSSVAFIITSFPTQHFGVLFGLLYATAGLASLASYPYRIWTTLSPLGFLPLHILLLCTAILSYGTPIWVIILYARHTQKVNNIVYNTKL